MTASAKTLIFQAFLEEMQEGCSVICTTEIDPTSEPNRKLWLVLLAAFEPHVSFPFFLFPYMAIWIYRFAA